MGEVSPLIILEVLVIKAAPLAFVFIFISLARKVAGGRLGGLIGAINNPNRGPFDGLRKKAEGYRDYRHDIAKGAARKPIGTDADGNSIYSRRGKRVRADDKRDMVRQGAKYESDRAREQYTGSILAADTQEGEDFRQGVAGGGRPVTIKGRRPAILNPGGMYNDSHNGQTGVTTPNAGMADAVSRSGARAQIGLDKLQGEELSAAQTVIKNTQMSQEELQRLAVDGEGTSLDGRTTLRGDFYQKAAGAMFVDQGRAGVVENIVKSGNLSPEVRSFMAYKLQTSYSTLKPKGHGLNDDTIKQTLIDGDAVGSEMMMNATAKQMVTLSPEYISSQELRPYRDLQAAITMNEHLAPNDPSRTMSDTAIAKARQTVLQALTTESIKNFNADTLEVAAEIVGQPVSNFQKGGGGPRPQAPPPQGPQGPQGGGPPPPIGPFPAPQGPAQPPANPPAAAPGAAGPVVNNPPAGGAPIIIPPGWPNINPAPQAPTPPPAPTITGPGPANGYSFTPYNPPAPTAYTTPSGLEIPAPRTLPDRNRGGDDTNNTPPTNP